MVSELDLKEETKSTTILRMERKSKGVPSEEKFWISRWELSSFS